MNATIISLAVLKSSGGPTKTIQSFKHALSARHFSFCSRVEIATGSLAVDGAEPVHAVRVPILKQLRFATSRESALAADAIRSSSFVSCHSFYRYHSIWVNRMSRKYGVPYWFVPHGILDPWVTGYGRTAKKLFWKLGGQRFLDEASTVIFSTRAEKDKAESLYDLPNADVVPWPVELVDINDREERRAAIRRQLGIPEEASVLIYFGRLHHMKRPLETIHALAVANSPSVHLIIVGNEQTVSLKDCENAARESGVQGRVHLVGPVYGDAKYDYLHASDAYISLSNRENFNHTAAESLAAGLPVVLSPGNDLQSEIMEQQCSWAVQGDEIQDAAQAIEAFVGCEGVERREMGLRGREWVAAELSFEAFQSSLQMIASRYARVSLV